MIGYYLIGKKQKGKNVLFIPGSLAILDDHKDLKISYNPQVLENLNDLFIESKGDISGAIVKKVNINDGFVKELSNLVWQNKDDEAIDRVLEIFSSVLGYKND